MRLILALGVAAIVIVVLLPQEETAGAPNKKRPALPSSKNKDEYTREDYSAKFARLSEAPRDAFKPAVIRVRTAVGTNSTAGAIPAALAGGDGNWVYTGMAEVDGTPNGLLENRSSGEAEFVRPGQVWRGSTIGEITATSITIAGSDAEFRTIPVAEEATSNTPIAAAAGTPVTPNFNGAIGFPGQVGQPGQPGAPTMMGQGATIMGPGGVPMQMGAPGAAPSAPAMQAPEIRRGRPGGEGRSRRRLTQGNGGTTNNANGG